MIDSLAPIVSFAKQRGFIFPSSEIYGGLSSSYDYGPLGVELKNNIKRAWWKAMVQKRNDVVGLDAAIFMHPTTWVASGHVDGFTDPLVDCKECKKRFRADHLLEDAGMKFDPKAEKIDLQGLKCPSCGGELTDVRQFNLLFKTKVGVIEDAANEIYLRGETCQGIYVNFESVQKSMRMKLPFGIAQIGKAFRNEITPGHFTYRTREFEQMEQQYFVHPDQAAVFFEQWKADRIQWYLDLGLHKDRIRYRDQAPDELAHYAKAACDLEYDFPGMGFKEIAGIHNRGDWDLSRHSEFSKHDLKYFDQETGEKFMPWIVETSEGADRATLAFLCDAYEEVDARSGESDAKHEKEVVLRLHKSLAPIKAAILPLSKKEPISQKAMEVQQLLSGQIMTQYDDRGSIGKRYRRQDEIGTPFCITVDFDSLEDNCVTVRDRDTMAQERIAIAELSDWALEHFQC